MADSSTKAAATIRPPSLSFKTVTNFLYEDFKDKTIPSHIDRSVLSPSMSGSNQTHLISALKFLGLISGNNIPEPNFTKLVKAEKEERAAIWREILNTSYNFLLQHNDIERATTKLVWDRFKEMGISGDTIRKSFVFFQYAAKEAEIKVSPHINPYHNRAASTRPRTNSPKNGESKDGGGTNKGETADVDRNDGGNQNNSAGNGKPDRMSLYQMLIEILTVDMEEEEQKAVWTLIRYLKKQEANKIE